MILTYTIADIHGSFDKLVELMRLCNEDAADHSIRYIFLGDYVDRGPDSRAVIRLLTELEREYPGRDVFLKGNHEDMPTAR
jgi:serine/threonine protein phosphatase 1